MFGATLRGSNVTSLNLSRNELNELTKAEWQVFDAALKDSNVTSLNLSRNELNELTKEQWEVFGAALKGLKVTSLNLGWNFLCRLTKDKWREFGVALEGSKVTSLNLEHNFLCRLTKDKWREFGVALEGSKVTSLNLEHNFLCRLTKDKWREFGVALEGSKVTSLNLEHNFLCRLTKDKWREFGVALKNSKITWLGLDYNGLFYDKKPTEKDSLIEMLNNKGSRDLSLRCNGEITLQRVLLPMLSWLNMAQRRDACLPYELVLEIFSFLIPPNARIQTVIAEIIPKELLKATYEKKLKNKNLNPLYPETLFSKGICKHKTGEGLIQSLEKWREGTSDQSGCLDEVLRKFHL